MKRIAYIDLLKVLTIFLVILGHSSVSGVIPKKWIYAFHMPVFFALYGMTYSLEKHARQGFLTFAFVRKKFVRLMVPAIIWALGYSLVASFNDVSLLPGRLLQVGYFSHASLKLAGSLTSIWFIPCMFLAVLLTEVSFALIHRWGRDARSVNLYVVIAIVFYASVTFLLPRIHHGYPWCANVVPLATAMIMSGYLARQLVDGSSSWCASHRYAYVGAFAVSFVVLSVASWLNWHYFSGSNVDMSTAKFGNPWLYMTSALSGIVMMVALALSVSPSRLHPAVAFAGANTYGIFLIHKPLIVASGDSLVASGFANVVTVLLSAVVVLAVSCAITYAIDRICPLLVGNKRKARRKD